MRFCKDCKHNHPEDFGLSRCHAPAMSYVEPVRGHTVGLPPAVARDPRPLLINGELANSCGPEGRYFEPKEPTERSLARVALETFLVGAGSFLLGCAIGASIMMLRGALTWQ